MGLSLRIDFDNLTCGDLYRFADQARAAGVPEDQQVEQEWGDDREPIAFTVDLMQGSGGDRGADATKLSPEGDQPTSRT